MFYFYYPTEIERLLGPANISKIDSNDPVNRVTSLSTLDDRTSANNCLIYPTLYSLLSHCILDKNCASELIDAYKKLSDDIVELKKNSIDELACAGISLIGTGRSSLTIDSQSFLVSFNNNTSPLETMLADLYVTKNKDLKKMTSSLGAISRYMESLDLTKEDFTSGFEFVQEAMHIKSTFGSMNDIKNEMDSLHERTRYMEILEKKQEELDSNSQTLEKKLREEKQTISDLQTKLERAILQIQVLQENIVAKHQKVKVEEVINAEEFTKNISSLNTENQKLLQELSALKADHVKSEAKLNVSITELQKIQEHYEKKCSELSILENRSEELDKENRILAAKILDVNKVQLELSEELNGLSVSAEKDKKSAIAKQKILEREKVRFASRNAEISHKYSTLRYEMFCKNRELEVIQSSPFWKGGNALRALKSRLSRNKISDSVKADIALIATSEFFDFDWYVSTYDDVKEAGVDPAQHYLTLGAEEGRFPGPNFDGTWYLERYPDVADANINPLLHFIKCGKREGRVPSPKMIADKR